MTATDDELDEMAALLRSPKTNGADVRHYVADAIEALREQVAAAEAERDDALNKLSSAYRVIAAGPALEPLGFPYEITHSEGHTGPTGAEPAQVADEATEP